MFCMFEKLSSLYVHRCQEPTWRSGPNCQTDPWDSLRVFLAGYAFERQGRPESYAHAAVDAIDEVKVRPLDQQAAERTWQAFASRLGNDGLNHANNPLCPEGARYRRRYAGVARDAVVGKVSVIQLAATEIGGQPLVQWARQRIAADRVQEAHGVLSRVNGIGDKIASLFLRDVATRFGMSPATNRELLQPIDGWVRLVTRVKSGHGDMSDAGCARYIVEHSDAPEKANHGIWYFCAYAASSAEYLVRKGLADDACFRRLVRNHLDRLRTDARIAEDFLTDRGDDT